MRFQGIWLSLNIIWPILCMPTRLRIFINIHIFMNAVKPLYLLKRLDGVSENLAKFEYYLVDSLYAE